MNTRKKQLDDMMNEMPEKWRTRWCSPLGDWGCACVGGANCSGGLMREGFSKEDWEEWCAENDVHLPTKEERQAEWDRKMEDIVRMKELQDKYCEGDL